PEVGYIVRVSPKGYTPEPLPDFEKLSDAELVRLLESPSQVRVLAAQRALIRRNAGSENVRLLFDLIENGSKPMEARVAALFVFGGRGFTESDLVDFMELSSRDEDMLPFLCRLIGDHDSDNVDSLSFGPAIVEEGLRSKNDRAVNEAIVAVARQGYIDLAPDIATAFGDEDATVAHTAYRALAKLGAGEACFAVLDAADASGPAKQNAAFALMRIHSESVVDGVIARLNKETNEATRQILLSVLCRLHFHEGEWTGDSWGTRPDTLGPYYQPEPWGETEKVAAALKSLLAKADSDEAAFLVKEMSRNRIQSDDALTRILTLAKDNPKVVPDAVAQLAAAETIPAEGVGILESALRSESSDLATLSNAVIALARTDSKEAATGTVGALARLSAGVDAAQAKVKEATALPDPVAAKSEAKYARNRLDEAKKQLEAATKAFLEAPKLENHHAAMETAAAEGEGNVWADAALLALAARKSGSPESREMTQKAIDTGWADAKRRARLIQAAALTQSHLLDDRILVARKDADPEVAKAAKEAVKALKIQPGKEDNTPKIGTLAPEKALAEVIKAKGDVALGEQVFQRATCVACHTTSQDQPQKGPYLGNIAQTYQRPDLAANILDPNKTIAQGFASNVVTGKDGTVVMGFVTDEAGDHVTLRDIAAQEHTFKKADIAKRDTLPTSMMPPGLMNGFSVHEMASLLDYLQALAKK
ncbi:MAG: c-type cytochrome, partial [Verrucomicrobiae bacterium]|nr:c-type cytochrome [Verrucomicrobiae bacterium]